MIEMLTAFALVTAYAGSFLELGRERRRATEAAGSDAAPEDRSTAD